MINKSDDLGIAYGWFMTVAFLVILAPILYLAIGSTINAVLANLVGVTLSDQSTNAISFQVMCISSIPLLILAGSFVWSVNHGAVTRYGGPSTFQVFSGGFMIMITFFFVAFLLSVVAAITLDVALEPSFDKLYTKYDIVSSDWAGTEEGPAIFFINLLFYVSYAINFIGAYIYFQSCLKTTAGDRYG